MLLNENKKLKLNVFLKGGQLTENWTENHKKPVSLLKIKIPKNYSKY